MEQEGALPFSQCPAIYLGLIEFSPCFPAYFLKILFNIIIFPMPRSSKRPLALKFSYENRICTFPFPLLATYSEISVAYFVNGESDQIRGHLFQFVICQGFTLKSFSASFNPHNDHSLSALWDCLLIIFAAALHIWRPSPSSRRRAKPRRQASVNLVSAKSLLVISATL